MRTLIQRVQHASVTIDGQLKSKIGKGLLVLVGIEDRDTQEDIEWLCKKIANLRIFDDENGVMNRSVVETEGEVMVVSQFTLHASTKKGNRPSYIHASKPDIAIPMYEAFCAEMGLQIGKEVQTGTFGGMRIFGSAVDLLPALVTAAALLGGPAEAAVVGLTVGICYDLSFTGVDGLYPLFFLLFGYAAGKLCQRLLTRNYISMLILTAFECVLLGLLRYLFSLMHAGASFLIVLRQLAVGTVLTCLFCFIVYLPLRRLSGKSRKRSR